MGYLINLGYLNYKILNSITRFPSIVRVYQAHATIEIWAWTNNLTALRISTAILTPGNSTWLTVFFLQLRQFLLVKAINLWCVLNSAGFVMQSSFHGKHVIDKQSVQIKKEYNCMYYLCRAQSCNWADKISVISTKSFSQRHYIPHTAVQNIPPPNSTIGKLLATDTFPIIIFIMLSL